MKKANQTPLKRSKKKLVSLENKEREERKRVRAVALPRIPTNLAARRNAESAKKVTPIYSSIVRKRTEEKEAFQNAESEYRTQYQRKRIGGYITNLAEKSTERARPINHTLKRKFESGGERIRKLLVSINGSYRDLSKGRTGNGIRLAEHYGMNGPSRAGPSKAHSQMLKESDECLLNASFQRGPKLSDFTIVQTIGIGCYSKVKLARWSRIDDRPCVLKIVKKEHAVRLRQTDHLIWERSLLLSLSHPNIVKCLDTFQDNDFVYFVLEYCGGGEIYQIIRKHLKSQQDGILFYMAEVGMALEYLHEQGVVYRDLKPENVLIDVHGHAKLADFGLSKRISGNRTSTICGTPGYLAPEQLARKTYGREIDLWAYGIFLFELLAGYNPFHDQNPKVMYDNTMRAAVDWPSFLQPNAKAFIKRVLVIEPEARLPAKRFRFHPLFAQVEWDQMRKHKCVPPFVPNLATPFDTEHFYAYPDSTELELKMGERIAKMKETQLYMDAKLANF